MKASPKGKSADAEWVKRAFDEAWKDADTTLTIEALSSRSSVLSAVVFVLLAIRNRTDLRTPQPPLDHVRRAKPRRSVRVVLSPAPSRIERVEQIEVGLDAAVAAYSEDLFVFAVVLQSLTRFET